MKDRRFNVTCPECDEERSISYVTMTLIRRGKLSGACHSCAHGLRGRDGRPVLTALAKSLRRTRFHVIWIGMRDRCENPKADNWKYYGGDGIRVCERWESFDAFTEDMYPTYRDGLTIDRIDRKGPYSPENCRWITQAEQMVNTRRNRLLTFQGRTQTLSQWAKETGISYFTLRSRILQSGWTIEEALTTPVLTRAESGVMGAETKWA